MDSREFLAREFDKLRDELVSQQALRTRLLVVKLGAVTGAFVTATTAEKIGTNPARALIAVAPILAVLLDHQIDSLSLSIKRIGHYIRTQVEPTLLRPAEFEPGGNAFQPYEGFMAGTARPTRWVVEARRPRWFFTRLSVVVRALTLKPTWVFTGLAAPLSFVALWPGSSLAAPGVGLPWLAFGFWFFVLALFGVWAWRSVTIPLSVLTVSGKTGDVVLVPGQYTGRCCSCDTDLPWIQRVLERGDTFPPLALEGHDAHTFEWTLDGTPLPRRSERSHT